MLTNDGVSFEQLGPASCIWNFLERGYKTIISCYFQLGQYEQKMQLLKQELKKMQEINRASETEVIIYGDTQKDK